MPWGGCATPPRAEAPAPATVKVVVENLTGWPWRVAFEPLGTGRGCTAAGLVAAGVSAGNQNLFRGRGRVSVAT